MAQYFLILYVLVSLIFVLFRIIPGDPTTFLLVGSSTEETRQYMLEQFGLNRPLHEQYVIYIVNVAQGEWGISYFYRDPVFNIIFDRLANTLVLMVPAFATVMVLAYFLGSHLGWMSGDPQERLGSYSLIALRAIPHFVLGLFLLMGLSYWLGWFPTGGMVGVTEAEKPLTQRLLEPDFYRFWFLPYLTVVLHFLADPYLLMRGNIITERNKDYTNFLTIKGLPTGKVREHAAKNSLLPLITWSTTLVGIAFGGQILIEIVFSWPGIGRELVHAVIQRDYPLAQAATVLIAFVVLTANLVIDIIYGFLDPRIRYE